MRLYRFEFIMMWLTDYIYAVYVTCSNGWKEDDHYRFFGDDERVFTSWGCAAAPRAQKSRLGVGTKAPTEGPKHSERWIMAVTLRMADLLTSSAGPSQYCLPFPTHLSGRQSGACINPTAFTLTSPVTIHDALGSRQQLRANLFNSFVLIKSWMRSKAKLNLIVGGEGESGSGGFNCVVHG